MQCKIFMCKLLSLWNINSVLANTAFCINAIPRNEYVSDSKLRELVERLPTWEANLADINIFVLKSHNNLQLMLIKNMNIIVKM